LKTKKQALSPDDLIRALLTCEIDVIWNGGIGTYVKASYESNEEIGDKNNDPLRVNGKDLKAKIVAEGGNLGFSQRGRIEFALGGGYINTDFIDNSAGVDCSDHEVNIKICLSQSILQGKINLEQRNQLLAQMTEEVATLVLADNFSQTQAITIRQFSELFSVEIFSQLIETLEQSGLLNREVEFLPSKDELNKRIINKANLTRPEIAVLVSYSKMFVYNQLILSNIDEEDYFKNKILLSYFPKIMQEQFKEEITKHQLRKEIISTIAANAVINKLSGPLFVSIMKDSDVSITSIVKTFFIVNEIFDIDTLWSRVEVANINKFIKIKAFTAIIKLLRRAISWILKKYSDHDLKINDIVDKYKSDALELIAKIEQILPHDLLHKTQKIKDTYINSGIDDSIAEKLAQIEYAVSVFDIIDTASQLKGDKLKFAKLYFKIGNKLKLDVLRYRCDEIARSTAYLNKLSAQSLKADLYSKQIILTKAIGELSRNNIKRFTAWHKRHKHQIVGVISFIDSLVFLENFDINILVLASHKIQHLVDKIK
jgi:glutamate dehydrogenase